MSGLARRGSLARRTMAADPVWIFTVGGPGGGASWCGAEASLVRLSLACPVASGVPVGAVAG